MLQYEIAQHIKYMPKTKPGWTTINKQQLEIVYRDPADLLPYARNAKIHTDKQIEKLAKGIIEYGFTDPIAIDENGEIVAGHGRLLAAKKLNLKSVPTVQLLGWTEAQKVAYRNFHNKITLETDFDPDLLKLDMDFLSEMDFDLELTGWDNEDLSSYLEMDTTEFQAPERQDIPKDTNQSNIPENQNRQIEKTDNYQVADNVPMSSVRMAQLFLNTETHPLFLEMTDKLSEIYGTDNPTDCVMSGLKELCENHSIEI